MGRPESRVGPGDSGVRRGPQGIPRRGPERPWHRNQARSGRIRPESAGRDPHRPRARRRAVLHLDPYVLPRHREALPDPDRRVRERRVDGVVPAGPGVRVGVEHLDRAASGRGPAADAVDEHALRTDGPVVARPARAPRRRARCRARSGRPPALYPARPEGSGSPGTASTPHPTEPIAPPLPPTGPPAPADRRSEPPPAVSRPRASAQSPARYAVPPAPPPAAPAVSRVRSPARPRTQATWRGSSQPSFHLCQPNRSGARPNWLPMRSQSPT